MWDKTDERELVPTEGALLESAPFTFHYATGLLLAASFVSAAQRPLPCAPDQEYPLNGNRKNESA
jgi:hypothetical protein